VGGDHANVARALSVLARVAAARRNQSEAVEFLGQALDVSRRTLGPGHTGTIKLETEYRQLTGGHLESS
jgi:tetratricopeptide repeat protein